MGAGCSNEGGFCVFGRKDEEAYAIEKLLEDAYFVLNVPIFALLSREELIQLASACRSETYDAGEVVVGQAERGQQFLVVRQGKAAVLAQRGPSSQAEQVAELQSGDCFGEEALLGSRPRQADVEALEDLEVWVLDAADFEKLGLRHRLHFRKRAAVMEGKGAPAAVEPELLRKTNAEHVALMEALLANEGLRPLLERLGQQELEGIADNAYRQPVQEGDVIVTQGELQADDLFYVVGEGAFDVVVYGRAVQQLGPGGSFGEQALLFRAPRGATVQAATSGLLWVVPRQHFREVLREHLRLKLSERTRLLGHVEVLKDLSNDDRQLLADALVEMTLYKGERLVEQGEDSGTFFILCEGEVAVEMDKKEVSRLRADPRAGRAEFFGERALLVNSRRVAGVRVVSQEARALTLSRESFERALGRNEVEFRLQFTRSGLREHEKAEYSLEHLERLGLLGTGACGTVTLVRDPKSSCSYALKALSKGLLVEMHQTQAVTREKLALQTTRSPFLVRLAATFGTEQHLYLLLEAAVGGDLYTAYRRQNLAGSQAHGRFYVACALRALEHLHGRHVIHRDLKQENLLLDQRGYCKLADFGSAAFALGHTCTLCGTPECMAPEVIAGTGHTCAADWWSLGVLAYECMAGENPFAAKDVMSVFHKVQRGIEPAELPDSEAAAGWPELVRQLCRAEPGARLPMRKGGLANVTEHAWFAAGAFDWQLHGRCAMEAPYVPQAPEEEAPDPGHVLARFDACEQEGPAEVLYTDPGANWDADFANAWGPRLL